MRPKPPADRLPVPDRLPFVLALRRRPRLRRWLGAGLAVAVAVAVAGTVRRAEAARTAWGRREPVVVAARDLAPGHVLEAGDTEVVELPDPVVPDGALSRVDAGRVVRSGAYEGEVLLRQRLAQTGVNGVAAVLPSGRRAVAVPVEPGSAPPLVVGHVVDAVGILSLDGVPEAALVATRAPVVHVAERAVTIAVEPETVARLAAALASGAVTLALVG